MPLKRTPPPSPMPQHNTPLEPEVTTVFLRDHSSSTSNVTLRLSPSEQLHSSSSEPNLNEVKFTNTARKRKHSLYDDDKLNTFMTEMQQMFTKFKEDQNRRSERLCSIVEDIRNSVDFLAHKYDSRQSKVDKLESDPKADVQYMRTLEDKIENLERNSRSTCLEIRNIPVLSSETKSDPVETFVKTCNVINAPVQNSEVKDIFRIKTNEQANKGKTIIVDLTSSLLKERIISMYRKYNRGNSKLTTE
ncbi:uncharacterized protein LOC131849154 [Achroia grisella]|uniref:uncharacterized protein LOC131849154 n=1 Tax=Achroia grisella TaxID=688607 RepID=UPI0027D2EA53|nr:uncharacterized protein LOC131849154 [Achroia grisella]